MTTDKAKDIVLPLGSQSRLDLSLSLTSHSPAQQVTTIRLDGQNFSVWSHSLRLLFGDEGKMS